MLQLQKRDPRLWHVIAGVLLAMPIGPVNLLGLQRAVERGFFGGLAAGLGIVLSDGLLVLLAALGVNAVSGAIREYRAIIQALRAAVPASGKCIKGQG